MKGNAKHQVSEESWLKKDELTIRTGQFIREALIQNTGNSSQENQENNSFN